MIKDMGKRLLRRTKPAQDKPTPDLTELWPAAAEAKPNGPFSTAPAGVWACPSDGLDDLRRNGL
ncbi:hypothetical protein [Pseudoprimorskyibacter insulae]|uniref:Uncharacterized protein n=1 Tax=Pseudoprimorskyibacter insulae TaxID=1695997 RepID=A0A2R8ANC0_9RHOB|nr:hypothetical protein [Pseudoprimorskyibacter insulae]SPF77510.1 hypothetical protein PRI8871_00093 [Pseudoprimorskyibacter insulae]